MMNYKSIGFRRVKKYTSSFSFFLKKHLEEKIIISAAFIEFIAGIYMSSQTFSSPEG